MMQSQHLPAIEARLEAGKYCAKIYQCQREGRQHQMMRDIHRLCQRLASRRRTELHAFHRKDGKTLRKRMISMIPVQNTGTWHRRQRSLSPTHARQYGQFGLRAAIKTPQKPRRSTNGYDCALSTSRMRPSGADQVASRLVEEIGKLPKSPRRILAQLDTKLGQHRLFQPVIGGGSRPSNASLHRPISPLR